MPDKLVFLPEARQDIAEAYSWYKGQVPDLAWISSDAWKLQSCQSKDIRESILSFTRTIVAYSSDIFLMPFFRA